MQPVERYTRETFFLTTVITRIVNKSTDLAKPHLIFKFTKKEKNTKGIIINYKGTRMFSDGKD